MTYSVAAILSLASQCAPNVAPQTVAAIVRTESQGRPFALYVNGARQPAPSSNVADAVATARRFVASGHSVDLGLGQINSRNMRKLGLTWGTVFDPCTNIAALGRILTQNYQAVADGRHPQTALRLALSMYNTGSTARGFRNGYVARVVGNAGTPDTTASRLAYDPEPTVAASEVRNAITVDNDAPKQAATATRPPPAWNVFERAAYVRTALAQSTNERGTLLWTR